MTTPIGLIVRGSAIGSGIGLPGAGFGARFVGGTNSGPPADGNFKLGDFIVDRRGKIYVCSSEPATWTLIGPQDLSVYETQAHASSTYATISTVSAIDSSLTSALGRIATLEEAGGGGGGGFTTGTWAANMVVECNNGDGDAFSTTWTWLKLGSFVMISCTSHPEFVSCASGAISAHINCETPLPNEILVNTWTSTIDMMVLRGVVSGSDDWQYQSANIQFSPLTGSGRSRGIRMWYLSGGSDFTGWSVSATSKMFVFPTATYTYCIG